MIRYSAIVCLETLLQNDANKAVEEIANEEEKSLEQPKRPDRRRRKQSVTLGCSTSRNEKEPSAHTRRPKLNEAKEEATGLASADVVKQFTLRVEGKF